MSTALSTLEARARYDGPEHIVFVRTAACDDKIFIDLCDKRWRAIEVDASGWRVVNEPSVRFRRSPGMLALPEPEHGDPKDGLVKLRALLRIRDEDEFVIVVSCLLAALRGRGPFPVVIFTGEPGATKTTTVKALRSLIDLNSSPVRSPPRVHRRTSMSRPTQDTCSASTTCPISQTGCRTRSALSPKAVAIVSARFTPTRMKACCLPARRSF